MRTFLLNFLALMIFVVPVPLSIGDFNIPDYGIYTWPVIYFLCTGGALIITFANSALNNIER